MIAEKANLWLINLKNQNICQIQDGVKVVNLLEALVFLHPKDSNQKESHIY